LVQGTLTWQAVLDHILGPYLRKPLPRQPAWLRNILRLGVYQIRYLDRVPDYAAVSQSVSIARSRGGKRTAGFVNAVLRGVAADRRPAVLPDPIQDPEESFALETSHPAWLVRRWRLAFGATNCKRLCDYNNDPPPLTIRANALRTTAHGLQKALLGDGIQARTTPLIENYLRVVEANSLFRTQAYTDGLFSVHGPGAGLVVRLLDPRPGDTLLDICSAPGGKCSASAERMGDRGTILALDIHTGRLRTLRESLDRLGLKAVRPVAADGRWPPTSLLFDRVLLDVPCSSLGVLSRHPELKWRRQETDLDQLAAMQQELLSAAAEVVAPGGAIVYSTCSMEPEENETVVETFLSHRNDFEIEPARAYLTEGVRGPYLQILPHEHGCDAAFAARLRRRDISSVEGERTADDT
jgi:16S rRNA (cytosine967-C5)-methyltransferase